MIIDIRDPNVQRRFSRLMHDVPDAAKLHVALGFIVGTGSTPEPEPDESRYPRPEAPIQAPDTAVEYLFEYKCAACGNITISPSHQSVPTSCCYCGCALEFLKHYPA